MRKSKPKKLKKSILIISLILLFTVMVGGTVALLLDKTSEIDNEFTPAKVEITINEETSDTQKSDISFTNLNDEESITVFIRATLALRWTDTFDITDDGKDNPTEQIIPKPDGADIVVPEDLGDNWFKVGDIYYYKLPVKPGETTGVMLEAPIQVTVPEGSLVKGYIDVHAEAIQASPDSVVGDQWTDVRVDDNGHLTAAN